VNKSISIEGKKVHYKVTGAGKPVVLIHGFAEDHDVWKHQVEELSKHCLLILPDLPGSGRSDTVTGISIEGMADTVKQVLDAEGIAKVIVIGHSMGGYIALALAEKHAGMLDALGLFHSSSYADTEEKKATRRKSIEFIQSHGSHAFLNQSSPNLFSPETRTNKPDMVTTLTEQYKNFDPAALTTYYEAMMQRPDRTAVLKSFEKPVLFVIGKHDSAVPFAHSLEQSKFPQLSFIHILQHSAHMGMWEEEKKANSILVNFINGTAGVDG
jgi:pimeloyl-ACP methyl ester carboxylesterase